jgi:hypothetical protein
MYSRTFYAFGFIKSLNRIFITLVALFDFGVSSSVIRIFELLNSILFSTKFETSADSSSSLLLSISAHEFGELLYLVLLSSNYPMFLVFVG